ncbi:MAG: cadmium-translocating P-type ATPase [Bacteroides sp.]|nr:cadmium-translocating P-type ATPase [Bacillota bacterium]MCM1393643.1 cadmium-translocating P-type ATPase [[Eubacterium] siraeum]MCM1456102.1 cadmium-translocating P-type ATPase [Bacteroides sp.]
MKLSLSKKEQKILIRIIVSLAAFIVLIAIDKSLDLAARVGGKLGFLLPLFLYLAIYAVIGYDVLFRAARNICHGQVFDENFLMVIATLGAFALGITRGVLGQSTEGFDEACAVLLFYQVGEFFQRYATAKSRKSISSLMDIRPDSANVLRDGKVETIDPSEVKIGEIILINPGEKIPLDGVCINGATSLDTKALTGESLPREIREGDQVLSGFVNLTAQIEVRVEKEFYDSTVSKILDLVENASDKKSKTETFITKFARYYTPTVVFLALALLIIPSAVTGDWLIWTYRALSFLVVSCPCALVISIPLSFFAGIGASSKRHILIKGSNYIEQLAKANVFVFDKTGTLTKGNFAVTEVYPAERKEEILRLAAVAEQGSSHPIAKSIISAYGKAVEADYTLTDVSGKGVIATNGTTTVLCGNEKLMSEHGISYVANEKAGTAVYVAKDGEFAGYILIADELKDETADVIADLNAMGARTVMLTGDNGAVASEVAKAAGVSEYKSSLLPQDKVAEVEKLLADKKKGEVVCFIGDGINDAPVLMRSDIGIAMGGVGSDAAIEASDVVLMKDDLRGLPLAKRIAKKTMGIAYQNILFSILVKVAILILSALGITNMWIAVLGDVGVAVIAILNAMRNSTFGKKKKVKNI